MTIDCLIVVPSSFRASYVPDRVGPLLQGLRHRGLRPAVLTLSPDLSPPEDVPVLVLDYPRRVAAGERWDVDVAHRYGVQDFRDFAYCEFRYLQQEVRPRPYSLLMEEVPAAFAEVERLFRAHDIRRVFHPFLGGEIIRRTASAVARGHRVPVLYDSGTRYFPGRLLFVRDDGGALPVRPRVAFRDLAPAAQRRLRAYLEQKRAAEEPVRYWRSYDRRLPVLAAAFLARGKFLDPARVRRGLHVARKHLEFAWSKRSWREPDLAADFAFLPLYLSEESNIILRSPQCYDQGSVVESVARALPRGVQLYIKQHPHNPAEFGDLRTIRRASRLENTRVIPIHTRTSEIIRAANIVVAVHGTAGYEAVLLRRPSVVLGFPPYRGWGVTFDVDDLGQLPAVLERALASQTTEEQVLDFLASFDRVHVPGDWHEPPLDPDVLAGGLLQAFDMLEGEGPRS